MCFGGCEGGAVGTEGPGVEVLTAAEAGRQEHSHAAIELSLVVCLFVSCTCPPPPVLLTQTTPFIWLDEQTGSQLIYMVHPGQ